MAYIGVAKTRYAREERAKIRWVKKPNMVRSTLYLYYGNKKLGEISNSTYSGQWMWQVYEPHSAQYVSDYYAARRGLLKALGMDQFYKRK